MNPISVELTTQELAQTALGVPKITGFNVSVLQSLIDLILKKLDCQSDTVTLTGCESQCLQELLRQSKISPLPFNDENVESLSAKMKRLSALEDRMAAVMQKLDDHMTSVRKINEEKSKKETSFQPSSWQHYSKPTEDLCTIPTLENRTACYLIRNHHFDMTLMHLVGEPLKERLQESGQKIENLHLELLEFTRWAHELYKKIVLIEGCVVEIEKLRQDICTDEAKFLSTIEEIQLQLESKLRKIFIKELEIYIHKASKSIMNIVEQLRKTHTCPGNSKPPKSNTTDCLSCGGVHTCSGQRPFHVNGPYDWSGLTKTIVLPFCGCVPACLDPSHRAALRQHIEATKSQRDANSPDPELTCKPNTVLGELRGVEGSYYYKG